MYVFIYLFLSRAPSTGTSTKCEAQSNLFFPGHLALARPAKNKLHKKTAYFALLPISLCACCYSLPPLL